MPASKKTVIKKFESLSVKRSRFRIYLAPSLIIFVIVSVIVGSIVYTISNNNRKREQITELCQIAKNYDGHDNIQRVIDLSFAIATSNNGNADGSMQELQKCIAN